MSMLRERRVGVQLVEVDVEVLRLDRLAAVAGLQLQRHLADERHVGTTTDWHRSLIVAFLNAETATGCAFLLALQVACRMSTPPYCDEASTVEVSGRDLELLAGHAERRGERTLCQADADRGRCGHARHHDNGEPLPSGPATSQDSMTFLLLGRTSPVRAVGPGLGWEKCYVLGKESACDSQARRCVRNTGDHPRATTTGHALAQPAGQALPVGQETPLSTTGATAAGPLGGDPPPRHRLAAGLVRYWTERGRSWSIHGRGTRGFVTQRVTAG